MDTVLFGAPTVFSRFSSEGIYILKTGVPLIQKGICFFQIFGSLISGVFKYKNKKIFKVWNLSSFQTKGISGYGWQENSLWLCKGKPEGAEPFL